MHLNRQTMINL